MTDVAPLQTGIFENIKPDRPSPGALAARFVVPPFTVLDARAGYWQERKRQWLTLGMKGDVGRESQVYILRSEEGRDLIPGSRMMCGKNSVYLPIGVSKEEWNEMLDKGAVAELGRVSIFDPVLAEICYRWFCPPGGLILDPTAGGSVRGIVAAMLGRQYLGIDLSERQIASNREQAEAILGSGYEPYPAWINGDALEMVPALSPEADFIFTCPPYGDLEVYSNDPRDLSFMEHEAFVQTFRQIVRDACACLKPDRFAAMVVGDFRDPAGHYRNFPGQTIRAFLDAGLHLYNEAVLFTASGTDRLRAGRQFRASRKLVKSHQNVLVFCKGDWEKAVKAVGPVDVTEE